MTDKREEIVQRLDKARATLQELLKQIPPETEIYPGWTLRQFYAHLTGWDDVVTMALRAHASGQTPDTPAVKGVDAYNAESVATRSTLDYDHIVKEWRLAREQLKAALRELPLEKLDEPVLYPWGPTGSVERMVGVLIGHEGKEHADELREWLVKRTTV